MTRRDEVLKGRLERRKTCLKRRLTMFRERPEDTVKQEARILKQLERLNQK